MEITQDEVVQILRKKLNSKKFDIVDFNVKMFGEWVGLCDEHATLEVTYTYQHNSGINNRKKSVFFLKLYPRQEFVVEFIEGTLGFKKEVFLYKLLDLYRNEENNLLDECVSRCFLSVSRKCIVLENLVEDGYKCMTRNDFLCYDSICIVLEALAKFHASTLIYEETTSSRISDIFKDELTEAYFSDKGAFPLLRKEIDAALFGILNCIKIFDLPEKLSSGKDFRTVLAEVIQKVFTLAKPSQKFRNVICHGDIWTTNILIKKNLEEKPIQCKLVDFQLFRYTPPAQDVMSLFYLTTSRDFRQKFMYELIGKYYNCLEKHITGAGLKMKDILNFEDFLQSCKEQQVFGMVQAGVYFPLVLLPTEFVEEYFGDTEKYSDLLFVDRSILVKTHMNTFPEYSARICNIIKDMKDFCDYF